MQKEIAVVPSAVALLQKLQAVGVVELVEGSLNYSSGLLQRG